MFKRLDWLDVHGEAGGSSSSETSDISGVFVVHTQLLPPLFPFMTAASNPAAPPAASPARTNNR